MGELHGNEVPVVMLCIFVSQVYCLYQGGFILISIGIFLPHRQMLEGSLECETAAAGVNLSKFLDCINIWAV